MHSVVITGANRGIGYEFVRQLTESCAPLTHIIATDREPNQDLERLTVKYSWLHVLPLDLKDFNLSLSSKAICQTYLLTLLQISVIPKNLCRLP